MSADRPQTARAGVLEELAAAIAARRGASPGASYTAELLEGGVSACARKFGEEAVELVIAALEEKPGAVRAEAADVLYHLLVLLEAAGVDPDEVYGALAERRATGGHAEKAARATGRKR